MRTGLAHQLWFLAVVGAVLNTISVRSKCGVCSFNGVWLMGCYADVTHVVPCHIAAVVSLV